MIKCPICEEEFSDVSELCNKRIRGRTVADCLEEAEKDDD